MTTQVQKQCRVVDKELCEKVLLYDANKDYDTDKVLSLLISNKVNKYLSGNQDMTLA